MRLRVSASNYNKSSANYNLLKNVSLDNLKLKTKTVNLMPQRINKNKFAVKSNDLVEARYRLSLQESHVILWLLTQISPDDEDFKTHQLKVEDFAKMVGLRVDAQYSELKKTTLRLMQRVMQIYSDDEKKLIQVSWLSSAVYEEGSGYVSLEFSPQLKPYLLQLKSQFTKINIADALGFKSIYAVRIYELLVQYSTIGRREITVEGLRDYCGIKDNEYPFYGNLRSRVLEKAKTEINEKTDYIVAYKEIKKSRKVDKLDWSIDKKELEATIAQPKEQKKQINVVPINYGSCQVPEVIEFCKHQESILRRDLIDYLLNATSFTMEKEKVSVGFSAAFFRDRCDTEEVKTSLSKFFKAKRAEVT